MAIDFSCPCGKVYSVADELAGKRTRCPACKMLIEVPEPIVDMFEGAEIVADFDVVEDDVPAAPVVTPAATPQPEISENALAYKTSMSSTTALRIVRVGDELLFLEAGPYFLELDADYADKTAMAGAAGGGVEGGLGGDFVGASIGGALGAMKQMREEAKKEKAEKRWRKLDAMTVEELRREVREHDANFVATADDLSDVRFDPLSFFKDAQRPYGEVPGVLRFTHETVGPIRLYFTKITEIKKAVYLFVDILGKKDVTVNLPIRKKRRS